MFIMYREAGVDDGCIDAISVAYSTSCAALYRPNCMPFFHILLFAAKVTFCVLSLIFVCTVFTLL